MFSSDLNTFFFYIFFEHYSLPYLLFDISCDYTFSNLTPSILPLFSVLPTQSYRVLPRRLPFLSTLFARFSCQRRLTIHKWLWPLTPLVHLRAPNPLTDWLSACTVSLGECAVVHFRLGLREVVQTVTATTTFTYAKLVLFLGPCLGIESESERDKSTKSQTNPMQQLYPFPPPPLTLLSLALFLGHADILRVGQICSCCLITF